MKTASQFTNKDGFVLLVKCLNRDGTGYGGFEWPKAGPVENPHWSRTPNCDSGGLFGWAWGMVTSEGKDPDACAPWLVFRAKPENIIEVSGKQKVVPGEDGSLPEVVYYGTQAGAMNFTHEGRMAYVSECSMGSASQNGDNGSASQHGDNGSASQTGFCGSASQHGNNGWAEVFGTESCAVVLGIKGKAKGKKGCWLTISEWKIDKSYVWHRIDVQTKKVDGVKIKADTWYQLKRGKFVKA